MDPGVSTPTLRPAPFRFFDLPPELRIKILALVLVVPYTIDLDPANGRRIAPLLAVLRVSRRLNDEAYRVFYGQNTFRLFPVHGGFFNTKNPLLARLPTKYRAVIRSVELRLGPGWNRPPKGWTVGPRLNLSEAKSLRVLKIFIECDPSHEMFRGFRVGKEFYTQFCTKMLDRIITQVGSLDEIQFDGYPSVSKNSGLMQALLNRAKAGCKRITWGSLRGWPEEVAELEECLATLTL